MTTEHDEQLVERVALAMANAEHGTRDPSLVSWIPEAQQSFRAKARAVIYPPAPPKTRLQVARELLAEAYDNADQSIFEGRAEVVRQGDDDIDPHMRAIIAALALPAMED